ncbi:Xaa-Pro peptidase family protein [Martelella sp. HB161492]|uniref:M24 family metallopeptidase n=1 Tax=Martelella sp. HB161492 TaxID=2720726 RepID=UPI0015908A32|nr:Xaa-Pro peptidase family protein [Martelella sp. HB161492]
MGFALPAVTIDHKAHLARLRESLDKSPCSGVLLGSTSSLRYFTGLEWHQSERLVGALVTADRLTYIVPGFEKSRVETLPRVDADIAIWEEEESPAALIARLFGASGTLALDPDLPLFVYYPLAAAMGPARLADGSAMISAIRAAKSADEIAIIQYAMNVTLEVQKRVHKLIEPGIRASDVVSFIDRTHRELCGAGNTFAIASFGTASSLPHGADGDQTYAEGDVILIDTGTQVMGYQSDLTRTYVKAEPTKEFARIWAIEREAEQAVFDAAAPGVLPDTLDEVARKVMIAHGLGPDYHLPGLPHRAGHGLGLDIHEAPYIVRGNKVPLAPGNVFSDEPMIVVPGQFGVRLEDFIRITETGAEWFTTPAKSPTEPFS